MSEDLQSKSFITEGEDRHQRLSNLMREKKWQIYKRYPNLDGDPFAVLAAFLFERKQTAFTNALSSGLTESENGLILQPRINDEEALKLYSQWAQCFQDFESFSIHVLNSGYSYTVSSNEAGKTQILKKDIFRNGDSDWVSLEKVYKLASILDYWDDALLGLNEKALNDPKGVIPEMITITDYYSH